MKKILNNLFMFESKTNVLLYIINKECYLIDTGISNRMKDEIKSFLIENNLKLAGIINTHCHSDHINNNDIADCKIYASEVEKNIIENGSIQLDMLYGGKHPNFMENSFVFSKSFKVHNLEKIKNIEYIFFQGHSYNMIGVNIENKVLYIGDAIYSKESLNGIPYTYDIKKFIESLNKLREYKDITIISSHSGIIDNIDEMIDLNLSYINDMSNDIISICNNKKTFDNILESICRNKKIELNKDNYFLISFTIKSFISYLVDNNLLEIVFEDYCLYYISK